MTDDCLVPKPISEWTEKDGDVLWWKFPIKEAPYVGSPNDLGQTVEIEIRSASHESTFRRSLGGWPGYHTHWTPIPIPNPVCSFCEEQIASEFTYDENGNRDLPICTHCADSKRECFDDDEPQP